MTDHTARFRAYSNYLIGLARLIEIEYQSSETLIHCVAKSKGFQNLQRRKIVNCDGIAQSLRLSWHTELLLCRTISYSGLLPLAMPWSMVQTYYAIYPTIRCYFAALGRDAGRSHETTLKTIGSDFVLNKGRFLHPWCCVYTKDPEACPSHLTNFPGAPAITLSNPLTSPHFGDPWQHYGLFLRTTRKRMLHKKIEQWKKDKHRKRITGIERNLLLQQLRPTNIFDALYRIRERSNYHDIDSFAFALVQHYDYENLQAAMCKIVDNTQALFEMIIAKVLGKNMFTGIVREFALTPVGNNPNETYLRRWEIIEQLL
jgi:hypothetical protein